MASNDQHAKCVFRRQGGMLRTREAMAAGIHPRTLYAMRDSGEITQLARGLFRLANLPPLNEPDLAIVAHRVPQGVLCLLSALAQHELTTHVPHAVHIALPRRARVPVLAYPPLQVYRFSPRAFASGIETAELDGISVRIYNAEKSLADCFKYRNKVGLDIALEALRTYAELPAVRWEKVLEYARVCRVERVMRPYLEALA